MFIFYNIYEIIKELHYGSKSMGKNQGKETLNITRRTLLKGSAALMLTACTSKKAVEETAARKQQ